MRFLMPLFLLVIVLVLSACASSVALGPRVVLSPPAADLVRPPEPVEPDPASATEKSYDEYSDAVLAWGRAMYDQLGRLGAWVETTTAEPK
jgi:hypothetical protein